MGQHLRSLDLVPLLLGVSNKSLGVSVLADDEGFGFDVLLAGGGVPEYIKLKDDVTVI